MKKIFILALGFSVLFNSCSNEYLELTPTSPLSKTDIDGISKYSPHLANAVLNGLYSYNVLYGSGGTYGHDDFGQKGYDIYTDILSGDMNLNGLTFSWYKGISNFNGMTNFISYENYKGWRFYYYLIRGANNIISGLEGKELSISQKKIYAEAKAYRAYLYYNLVMMYTQGYEANEKILPIYTAPVSYNTPSKKTHEVFDLMIKDLKEALTLYEESGYTSKGGDVNYFVAKGILSYVYAAKGTNDALVEAAQLTNNIIAESGYSIATEKILLGGFNKKSTNPNWMWSAEITLENELSDASWYGQVDIFSYGYAADGDTKGMSHSLYDQISDDDIRKRQFVLGKIIDETGDEYEFKNSAILPVNKFYAHNSKKVGGSRYVVSDYVFMRIEEMYLLNAEVNSRIGNDTQARSVLLDLLETRKTDVDYVNNLSGKKLLDEILLQTRIELWGEGKAYMAIKRNKGVFHYGSTHLFFPNTSFQYDDPRLTFKVPQAEILNNTVYYN